MIGNLNVIRTEPVPGIVLLQFAREQSLNSMTHEFVAELGEQLDQIARDRDVRAVVLTGAGRGFSSGHDLDALETIAGARGDISTQFANQEHYSDLIVRIAELPQPVIAAVNGPAAGGGLAMALACDTRVCSESARFNAAFVRLGVSGCDVGVSYLLPRIVSPTLAFEMMLTGRLVDADEALRFGLVLKVVPDEQVVAAAIEIAQAIAGNGSFAVRMTKQAMRANLDATGLRQAIVLEDRTQVLALQTGEWTTAVPAVRSKAGAR